MLFNLYLVGAGGRAGGVRGADDADLGGDVRAGVDDDGVAAQGQAERARDRVVRGEGGEGGEG